MQADLRGKAALVTGASRGIGAATALKLAQLGCDIVLNYRSKAARAEEVMDRLRKLNVKVVPAQADITNPDDIAAMFAETHRQLGKLDFLILNASGGMEKDKPADYAMTLNLDAQVGLVEGAAELMGQGSRIVFVTSHWAHFYGQKPVMPEYEAVAKSKRAGEDALRGLAVELSGKGISLMDLQSLLIKLARPDINLGTPPLILSAEHRAWLLRAMTEYPRESTNPVYSASEFPDDYCKCLLPGIRRVFPSQTPGERIEITAKIGEAYGFTIENSYVRNPKNGRAVFVTAVIYTNARGLLNSDQYEYDTVAEPFYANLGELVARRWLGDPPP